MGNLSDHSFSAFLAQLARLGLVPRAGARDLLLERLGEAHRWRFAFITLLRNGLPGVGNSFFEQNHPANEGDIAAVFERYQFRPEHFTLFIEHLPGRSAAENA